jgi:hypothetical protein
VTGSVEYETTHGVADLDAVVRALVVREFTLDIGGEALRVDLRSLSRRVHFYSEATDFAARHRLKLWFEGHAVRGVRQVKTFIGNGEKWEETVEHIDSTRRAMLSINSFGPILGAFAKERLLVDYDTLNGESFQIGFDRLMAFDPLDPMRRKTAFHMEIEGSAGNVLRSSPFFETRLLPLLRPLERSDTKWFWAAQLSRNAQVAFEDKPHFRRYLRAILDCMTSDGGVLDPSQFDGAAKTLRTRAR